MWGIPKLSGEYGPVLPFSLSSSAHGVMSVTISSLLRWQVKRLNRIRPAAYYPKHVVKGKEGGQRGDFIRMYAHFEDNQTKHLKNYKLADKKGVQIHQLPDVQKMYGNRFLNVWFLSLLFLICQQKKSLSNKKKTKKKHNTVADVLTIDSVITGWSFRTWKGKPMRKRLTPAFLLMASRGATSLPQRRTTIICKLMRKWPYFLLDLLPQWTVFMRTALGGISSVLPKNQRARFSNASL